MQITHEYLIFKDTAEDLFKKAISYFNEDLEDNGEHFEAFKKHVEEGLLIVRYNPSITEEHSFKVDDGQVYYDMKNGALCFENAEAIESIGSYQDKIYQENTFTDSFDLFVSISDSKKTVSLIETIDVEQIEQY